MAVVYDEEWAEQTWFVRKQVCGTCAIESVVTGPRKHVDGVAAAFYERHGRCMGHNSMIDPAAVEHRRALAAEEARRRAAIEAATKAQERAVAAKIPSPRQQAVDIVFGSGR